MQVQPQQLRPAARGAAGGARSRRQKWGPWLVKRAKKYVGNILLLIVGVNCFSCDSGGMRKGIDEAGKAIAEVSQAAGSLAGASANATAAVAGVAVGAVSTAQHAAEELWKGVDLLNVTFDRDANKVVAQTPAELSFWFLRGANGNLDAAHLPWFASVASNISKGVPTVSASTVHFDSRGTFCQLYMKGRMRADGSVAAVMLVVNSSFVPQWSCPFWGFLGFEIYSQSDRIIGLFGELVADLEPLDAHRLAIDEDALVAEFGTASPGTLGTSLWGLGRRLGLWGGACALVSVCALLLVRRYAPARGARVAALASRCAASAWSQGRAGAAAARGMLWRGLCALADSWLPWPEELGAGDDGVFLEEEPPTVAGVVAADDYVSCGLN